LNYDGFATTPAAIISMLIRSAKPSDAVALERLLRDYLLEGYPGHLGTPADVLREEVLASRTSQRILLAEGSGQVRGFIAFDPVYDLHWASRGAQIADIYVERDVRGLGIALELIASLCASVASEGGVFIRGGAYNRPSTRAFFGRVAVVEPITGDTHLSARAFRHLASLAGRSARDIVRDLPPVEWNWSN